MTAAADPVTILAGTTFFALLWALAAWHKALDWQAYRDQLRDYRVLPAPTLSGFALLLPLAEGALALAWLFEAGRHWAGPVAALLLLAYAAAMAWNLGQGRDSIDCGCGGEGQSIRWALVARNALLAGAALLFGRLDVAAARPLAWLDLGAACAAALALYGFYIAGNQLLANNPPQRAAR